MRAFSIAPRATLRDWPSRNWIRRLISERNSARSSSRVLACVMNMLLAPGEDLLKHFALAGIDRGVSLGFALSDEGADDCADSTVDAELAFVETPEYG